MTNGRATPDVLVDTLTCLQALPSADEVMPGDKSVLGQVDATIETALETLGDNAEHDRLRQLLEHLVTLCGGLMLDEIPAAEAATTDLFAAIAALVTLNDETAQATIEQWQTTLAQYFPSADNPTAETAEAAPLVHDTIDIHSDDDIIIYTEFLSESGEHLDRIEASALTIENSGSTPAVIDDMFRCFHSMKGAAGFLGLTVMNHLCHDVETMLDRARKRVLVLDGEVVDVILVAIDNAKGLLGVLGVQLANQQSDDPAVDLPVVDIRPVLAKIEVILTRRETVDIDTAVDASKVGGALVLGGAVTQGDLGQALSIQEEQRKPIGEILVDMGATSESKVAEALYQTGAKIGAAGTIKVDTDRLDALVEMVGELVIAESLVEQDQLLSLEANLGLARNIANLSKITRNLQEIAMAMRMMPVRQTFQKMRRLVRDTARKTNKQVRLALAGEDTEIDKTVVEVIADPLVHLLRNAVDHGIELPDVRTAAGKPAEGTIHLNAFHQGGNVVIEVEEDGAGVNTERVLAKAIECGVATENTEYSETEILEMLFHPGLSTHDKATEISGRGVGMDVVRRNIEGLGGRVNINSVHGAGTTISVRLPLTLAIVDGMVIRVGEERYVLPTLSIEESIRPRQADVSTIVGQGEVMMVRGDLVPLLHLHDIFSLPGDPLKPWDALVIVITADNYRCGVVVEELLGQQQVVIKNLGRDLKGVHGISGGCIMGDGRVGLILDAGGLIHLAENRE